MPRISFFHGITIWMYWNEGQHQRPHFHVEYGEHLASVAFDGTVLGGELPGRQLRFVREWGAASERAHDQLGAFAGARAIRTDRSALLRLRSWKTSSLLFT
jgi:hypothetical protein